MNKTDTMIRKSKTLPGAIKPVPGRLAGKIAVVTGGARGIGKGIANRFAQEGATVLIADKDMSCAEETVREIGAFGGNAEAFCADVSRREDANAIIARTVEYFDGIDILVNNAGVIEFGSILECTPEAWDKMIAVDLTGAFYCTQAAARQMIRQGRGGRLVHIGSTASLFPAPFQAAYSVAKAGLLMLSRVAALEFIQQGITSNLLCPHGAVTDMNRNLLNDPSVMAVFIDGAAGADMLRASRGVGGSSPTVGEATRLFGGMVPVHQKGSALIIGPGGGRDVLMALEAGFRNITAVEINPQMVQIVKDYRAFNGGLYTDFKNVRVIVAEGRNFLRHSNEKYDLITLFMPVTKSSRGLSAFALSESYLFTTEAFADYYRHLTDEGGLLIMAHNIPEAIRITTTAAEMLQAQGLTNATSDVPPLHPWLPKDDAAGRLARKAALARGK